MLAVFSDTATLRHALAFEAELARAEATEGLIGPAQAEAIARLCADIAIDPAELRRLREQAQARREADRDPNDLPPSL